MSKLMVIRFHYLAAAISMALGCDAPCLVYAAEKRINILELTTNETSSVKTQNVQPVAVDIYIKRKHIYWSDYEKRSISRASLNGTGAETIIPNCGTVGGIAVDWLSGHLYWTNSHHKRIGVSNLDGTHRSIIISTNLNEPIGLAIDPHERLIFWSDTGNVPKIEKATLAGNDRQLLVGENILSPYSLAIDHSSNPKRLFWTDVIEYAVQSIKLDGSDRKNIIKLDKVNLRHPFGITINNNNIFLTDWKTQWINVIHKGNGSFKEALGTPVTGRTKTIMGIVMFDKSRQPQGSNPCTANNGGCSHLCLADRNGPKCSCPDGVQLNLDGKTCSKLEDFLLIADTSLSMIFTIPLDSTTQIVQSVIYKAKHPIKQPVAVDYDVEEERIYWSDTGHQWIASAFLNGSDFDDLHKVGSVEGISIDRSTRRIYWTIVGEGVIESSKLDGTLRKILIKSPDLEWPRGILASPIDRFIYWTEWAGKPKIGRAEKNGSSITVLIDLSPSASANFLALHPFSRTLYYTVPGQIVSYNLKTEEKKILNKDIVGFLRLKEYIHDPFGIAIYKEYIYWSDWKKKGVYGAKRKTGEELKKLVDFLEKPTGIKASFGQNTDSFPRNIICPSDYDIYNKDKNAFDKHEVELPTVKGVHSENSIGECSPSTISINDYGEHEIKCTAKFINENSISCSYSIRVKDHLCSRLSPPMNGQVKCATHCIVTCDEDFVLAKSVTKNMACYGAKWRPGEDRNINLFPACLAKTSPIGIEMTLKIAFKKACDKRPVTDAFVIDTISEFKRKLNEILTKAKPIFVIFKITNVSLDCSQKKRLLTPGVKKVIEIHFSLFLDPQISQIGSAFTNPARIVEATNNLLLKKVKDGSFTLTVEKEIIQAFKDSFKGSESAACSSQQITKSYYCLKCSSGMYFCNKTQDCEPCPMGSYQDKKGQTNCRLCPVGTSTVVMGTDTSLGCYGHKEILANISVGVTKLNQTKLKNVVAGLVRQHCQDEACPSEIYENIQRYGPTESLSIFPSDVVISRGYPMIDSEKGVLHVVLFIVASFKDDKPVFFLRAKLDEIFINNIAMLEKELEGKVVVNSEAPISKKASKESRSFQISKVIIGIAVGAVIALIAAVGFVIWCYSCREAAQDEINNMPDNEMEQIPVERADINLPIEECNQTGACQKGPFPNDHNENTSRSGERDGAKADLPIEEEDRGSVYS